MIIKKYQKSISALCLIASVAIITLSCDSHGSLAPQPQPQPRVSGNGFSGPETVVKAFCDFDARGKRFLRHLSDKERTFYQSLVHWEAEPVWKKVIIVKNYGIADIKKNHDTAEISVTYHRNAEYAAGNLLIQEKVEKIKFKITKTDTGWKIEGPIVCPHMDAKTLVKKLEYRLRHEENSDIRAKIQQDINVIKNLKYFSFEKSNGL